MVKTVAGFVALFLFLALAIFLPAGTLNYWQGWLYLAAFFGSCFLITLYLVNYDQILLAGRVNAGPTAETEKSQQVIQSLASVLFIALYVVAGLDYRFHWSHVPTTLVWISDVFVVLGFFIVFLVFRENSYTSATIEVASDQKVITTGPYHLVRHPMYMGAGLMLLFTGPALGSWVALPLAVLMIVTIAARAAEEEKFLVTHLRGYDQYRQTVRQRMIPYVW
ncbi:MAG: isoprenylcysteine carboxylmethyltransferase family protein [Caldilineaceae bacterium]